MSSKQTYQPWDYWICCTNYLSAILHILQPNTISVVLKAIQRDGCTPSNHFWTSHKLSRESWFLRVKQTNHLVTCFSTICFSKTCFFLSCFFYLYFYICSENLCISKMPGFFCSFKRAKGGFQHSIKQGLTSACLQGKQAEASKVLQLVNLILLMQSVYNVIWLNLKTQTWSPVLQVQR